MAGGHPVAVRAMVVRTILSDMVPRLALKTREIGIVDWSWSWRRLLYVGVSTSIGSSLIPALLAAAAIVSASVMIALTILAPWALRLLAFWEMSPS